MTKKNREKNVCSFHNWIHLQNSHINSIILQKKYSIQDDASAILNVYMHLTTKKNDYLEFYFYSSCETVGIYQQISRNHHILLFPWKCIMNKRYWKRWMPPPLRCICWMNERVLKLCRDHQRWKFLRKGLSKQLHFTLSLHKRKFPYTTLIDRLNLLTSISPCFD